jgi:hypothetical protein
MWLLAEQTRRQNVVCHVNHNTHTVVGKVLCSQEWQVTWMYVNPPTRDVMHWASSSNRLNCDALVSPSMSPILVTEYRIFVPSSHHLP